MSQYIAHILNSNADSINVYEITNAKCFLFNISSFTELNILNETDSLIVLIPSSRVTSYEFEENKKLKNVHKKYPKTWWKGISEDELSSKKYDKTKNNYGVKVGTSLQFWEGKGWINKQHPYGWVHWYCDFYMGKRCPDDERQVKRWKALAGKRGRFMRFLVTQIIKKNAKWNDVTVSPKIRQVLQHWGYKLTKKDFDNEIKRRKKS